MKKAYTVFLVLISISALSYLVGRSFRVSQVPYGAKFSCNTCHTNGGGTPRNPFGTEIENNFLTVAGSAGDVTWNASLAALDSDGDGFSNGQELQDPNGTWVKGSALPGDANAVTDPSDPNSHPPVTSVDEFAELPNTFALNNNYPNPFNPTTTISFSIAKNSDVKLDIYNSVGQLVTRLVDQNYAPGRYTSLWNGKNDFGTKVNSGIYFYRLITNNFTQTKRMILMK
ncbi:MAG: T9SS type A sorting domain-containing protein [Melioribacteraceae bacterium]